MPCSNLRHIQIPIFFQCLIALVLLSTLTACQSAKQKTTVRAGSISPETKGGIMASLKDKLGISDDQADKLNELKTMQEKMFSQITKKTITLNISTAANLNANSQNKGMAMVMTAYPIAAIAEVNQLGLDPAVGAAASTVLLEQVLLPNKSVTITPTLPPETTMIGLVFHLRLQQNRWKIAIPLDNIEEKGVNIQVGACDVRIVSGLSNVTKDVFLLSQTKPLIACQTGKKP